MEKALFFNIHSSKLKFQTEDAVFASFVEKNLYFFKCEGFENPDINISFSKGKPDADFVNFNNAEILASLGTRVYRVSNEYYYQFFNIAGFSLKAAAKDRTLSVIGHVDDKPGFGDLFRSGSDRQNTLHGILRNLIFYPACVYKETIENFMLLHAGSVSIRESGYLFFGLPGAGKSVVSLLSVLNLKAKFLSDNLVLAKEGFVHAFPELVRLSVDQTLIKKDAFEKVDIYIKGKQFYRVNKAQIEEKAKIKKMFLLRIGQANSVKKIDLGEFIKKALLVDACTKELQEYAVINLMNFSNPGFIQRHEKMAACFKGIDVYELCLKKGDIDLDFLKEQLN